MSRARADEDDERPGTIPWDDDHVARAIEVRLALERRRASNGERMNEKCETTDETTATARTRRRDRSRTSESLP
jgi:hypothetical protein